MASLKLTKKFGNPVEQAHNFRVAVFGQTGVGKTGNYFSNCDHYKAFSICF